MASMSSDFPRPPAAPRARYSSTGSFFRPVGPATTTSASNASSTVARSAAGEPLAMFPPRVARLRTCTDPQVAAARASSPLARPRMTVDSSRPVIVMVAPMTQPRSLTRI